MTLGDAAAMAIGFVVFVVVVGVGASILAGVQGTQTAGTTAYSATGAGLTGLFNLGNQSGTIGLIIGAAVIIGILVSAFYFSSSHQQ